MFHRHGLGVTSIEEAYKLLPAFLGQGAPILFAIALLCAGQSSTLDRDARRPDRDGGLSPPADGPVAAPADHAADRPGSGGRGDLRWRAKHATQRLLILSQVILSLQLSFAVIPLIHFTSNRRNMGAVRHPVVGAGPGLDGGGDHRGAQRQAGPGPGRRMGELGGRVGDRGSVRSR